MIIDREDREHVEAKVAEALRGKDCHFVVSMGLLAKHALDPMLEEIFGKGETLKIEHALYAIRLMANLGGRLQDNFPDVAQPLLLQGLMAGLAAAGVADEDDEFKSLMGMLTEAARNAMSDVDIDDIRDVVLQTATARPERDYN